MLLIIKLFVIYNSKSVSESKEIEDDYLLFIDMTSLGLCIGTVRVGGGEHVFNFLSFFRNTTAI